MFIAKPPVPPRQLQWKYSDEPALAEWSLKARPYNTDVANGIFLVFLIVSLVAGIWTGMDTGSTLAYQIFFGLLMFFISISLTLSMTHQRTNFAYRLTASGLEFCEWKVFPEWIPQLLKWLAIITGVGMLVWAMIDPALLIGAIVGPGLIGLMYLKMATSKNFREMHERYRHKVQSWEVFTKMTVFRRRSIIGLNFSWYNEDADEGVDKMRNSIREIYCQKKGFDELIKIVRAQLPESTPYTEAYIPIYA